ncbi:hypothetical protein HELRODRAFT_163313 [Helobdella robusta]|uniref:Uncharacterized protein n=1 Tax=Helobdella robusta TaxID=6412 RepID=T1ETW5_HELRO|nr:hypothetical protein HELRODRAFT_163313 [Helobdella robusta]ESN96266.1 hypothetical protein HELRODRAFT_163313 [Helobdella robusta]
MKSAKEIRSKRLQDFQVWCESYGVSKSTFQALNHDGYRSLDQVFKLRGSNDKVIDELKITSNEKAILRSALYQHFVDETVNRMAITSDESERTMLERSLDQQDFQRMKNDLQMRKMQKKSKKLNVGCPDTSGGSSSNKNVDDHRTTRAVKNC